MFILIILFKTDLVHVYKKQAMGFERFDQNQGFSLKRIITWTNLCTITCKFFSNYSTQQALQYEQNSNDDLVQLLSFKTYHFTRIYF